MVTSANPALVREGRSEAVFPSLVAVLKHRAAEQGERAGYLFLRDNDPANDLVPLSYAELDRAARAIGGVLQQCGDHGQRVLLLHQPGPDFVAAYFGCLYAGAVAVTTYPAHRSRLKASLPRLRALLLDAQCNTVLTTEDVRAGFTEAWQEVLGEPAPLVLASDTAVAPDAESWRDPGVGLDTVAFLQYTSGSTSQPRGVVVTHGNLLHNSGLIARGFEHDSQSIGVIWLPPYHDMGLIGGILSPLIEGFPTVLMPPHLFLQHPYRWLQTIAKVGGTVAGGPNFAYDLCVRKITQEQRATLDLSSWRVAFNGAEPIHADTMERFSAAFAPCGFNPKAFHPCYGLAESTLFVTGGTALAGPIVVRLDRAALESGNALQVDIQSENARSLVGCGAVSAEQQALIVDPASRLIRCDGEVGEVWVSGPSVAKGYWNRPDETERTFFAYVADTGQGPFLRTGDLGFVLHGELFITGRIKDLIIVSGRNLYPQDIEQVAQASHASLQPFGGAAFAVEHGGQERLVIAHEIQREFLKGDPVPVIGAIREAVTREYDVQPYAIALLKPGQIPRTSSGKVRRSLCRSLLMAGDLETIGIHPSSEHGFWK